MTALKPCPFCGGTNIEIRSNGMGDFYALCYSDDPSEQACGASTSDERCETEGGAASNWNRRPPAATAQREEDAAWCDDQARQDISRLRGAQRGGDEAYARAYAEDCDRHTRLAAYARAPMAQPTEEEVEAAAFYVPDFNPRALAEVHCGDCTRQSGSCSRCAAEEIVAGIRAALAAFIAKRNGG